ncbi:MAG TPA: hypothetical protein VF432_10800 [Thermoanaerobaculia bacterium]
MSTRFVVRDATGTEIGSAELVSDVPERYAPLKSLEWAKDAAMQYVVVPTAVIVFGLGMLDKASPDWLLKTMFSASSVILLLSSIFGGSLYLWIHGYVNRKELLAGGSLTQQKKEAYAKIVETGETVIPRLQWWARTSFVIGLALFSGVPLITLWRPSRQEPLIKAATISLPDSNKTGLLVTAPNGTNWIISRDTAGNLVATRLEIPMHRPAMWMPATEPHLPLTTGTQSPRE